MASKINYNNKAPFQTLEEIPDENKVNANDMNEIKTVVNNNADELNTAKEDIEGLQNGQGTASTDITSLKNRTTALETDNTTNKQNIQNLQTDNETNKTNITNLQNSKVDKVEGKNLSTNDFTNEYKQKLDNLSNYDDTEVKADIAELEEKVSTLEEDNTTNKTNIEALQEDNTQNKSDISDLQESQEEQDAEIGILMNALPSETQEGENINIKGTIPVKFKEFVLKGNSKQDNSDTMPSPEYPSEIKNVEGDVNVAVANKEKEEQQSITFPLAEGQKLMKGDYLADDGIHHKRKQIELDGTENWVLYTGYANNAEKGYCYYLNIMDCKIVRDTSISTHFKNVFGAYQESVGYIGAFSDNLTVKNKYFISDKETLEQFKTYLAQQKQAGTPVIVEYELAEEEIEPYTEIQQEAYNQLLKLKSYEGATNVYSTNETSPIFKVTAVKDINSVITQLNQLILENRGN